MCTVSWLHQPAGYHLLCNRDEKRTRGVALGPRIHKRAGVRFVAPADADFGGAWIAVNEFGVSLCLLNGSEACPRLARKSRGILLLDLIRYHSAAECAFSLRQIDLAPFAPFTIAILEPDKPAIVAEWDGEKIIVIPSADSSIPLTSSSYDPEGVRRIRRQEFARRVGSAGCVSPALLYEFHAGHLRQADAYSPCMHRTDAETVSFSWIVVTRSEIRFLYLPAAPCQCSRGEQQVLPRAA